MIHSPGKEVRHFLFNVHMLKKSTKMQPAVMVLLVYCYLSSKLQGGVSVIALTMIAGLYSKSETYYIYIPRVIIYT